MRSLPVDVANTDESVTWFSDLAKSRLLASFRGSYTYAAHRRRTLTSTPADVPFSLLSHIAMPSASLRRALLGVICCIFVGCAHSKFRASELPQRYAARPIQDYSSLNLTQFTTKAPDADTILPGDRLKVTLDPGTLKPDSEHEWKVSVGDSGEASIPNIGAVRLAGLTRTEAESSITQASLERDVFLTPSVEVTVEDRREQVILVTGAVANPGPLAVRTDELNLADVIVRAGGLTNQASGVVSVSAAKRAAKLPPGVNNAILPASSGTVQATTVSLSSENAEDLALTTVPVGSVVHVEPVSPRPIKVTGVIRNQDIEVPAGQNLRLLDALAIAGGPTYSNWISDRITISRWDPKAKKTIQISASVRKARRDAQENILLAPFDIVNVDENVLTFTLSTVSGFLGAGFNATRIAL